MFSPETVEQAKRAWLIFNQAMTNSSLKQRMGYVVNPREAWKIIEDAYAPYGTSQHKIWTTRFSYIRMEYKKDPTSYLARVDNIVDKLACLDMFPFKQDVNDAIVEGLTSDYDTE